MQSLRKLLLRHPDGFSPEMMNKFISGCKLWAAFSHVVLQEKHSKSNLMVYQVGEPILSPDRSTVSVEVSGPQTLGSRAELEDGTSYLLYHFMPISFIAELEEGLCEDYGDGYKCNWREATVPVRVSLPGLKSI